MSSVAGGSPPAISELLNRSPSIPELPRRYIHSHQVAPGILANLRFGFVRTLRSNTASLKNSLPSKATRRTMRVLVYVSPGLAPEKVSPSACWASAAPAAITTTANQTIRRRIRWDRPQGDRSFILEIKVAVSRGIIRPYFLDAFVRLAIILHLFEIFYNLMGSSRTLCIVDEFAFRCRPGRIFKVRCQFETPVHRVRIC